jgi:hypothetical protein
VYHHRKRYGHQASEDHPIVRSDSPVSPALSSPVEAKPSEASWEQVASSSKRVLEQLSPEPAQKRARKDSDVNESLPSVGFLYFTPETYVYMSAASSASVQLTRS